MHEPLPSRSRSMWSRRAREHALKLRNKGMSDATIGAMMGRSAKSVTHQLCSVGADLTRNKVRKPASRRGGFYNRVEVASMLGMALVEFMRHQIELEEEHGLPRSTRSRYTMPCAAFDRWLKQREYPTLSAQEFAEAARAAFLRACFTKGTNDKIINRAARTLRAAEALLQQIDG